MNNDKRLVIVVKSPSPSPIHACPSNHSPFRLIQTGTENAKHGVEDGCNCMHAGRNARESLGVGQPRELAGKHQPFCPSAAAVGVSGAAASPPRQTCPASASHRRTPAPLRGPLRQPCAAGQGVSTHSRQQAGLSTDLTKVSLVGYQGILVGTPFFFSFPTPYLRGLRN